MNEKTQGNPSLETGGLCWARGLDLPLRVGMTETPWSEKQTESQTERVGETVGLFTKQECGKNDTNKQHPPNPHQAFLCLSLPPFLPPFFSASLNVLTSCGKFFPSHPVGQANHFTIFPQTIERVGVHLCAALEEDQWTLYLFLYSEMIWKEMRKDKERSEGQWGCSCFYQKKLFTQYVTHMQCDFYFNFSLFLSRYSHIWKENCAWCVGPQSNQTLGLPDYDKNYHHD